MSTGVLRADRHIRQRRSQRVLLAVRVVLEGHRSNGQPFKEETHTVVVNAHGALVLLAEKVDISQALTIFNLKSGEQTSCKVTDVGNVHDGKQEVGIEFLEPSPRFWRVAFPPEDWSLNSPEAKRRTDKPVAYAKVTPVHSQKDRATK